MLGVLVLCGAAGAAPSAFETIHVFSEAISGSSPRAALVLGPNGVAYGTTLEGGTSNNGTVYQLTPVAGSWKWTESVIYSFAGGKADGANPAGSLVVGAGGVLYGTTVKGGSAGAGTVFQLTPPSGKSRAWKEAVIYSFAGGADGAAPHAGLWLGEHGELYGTTANGGGGKCKAGCGTIFALTPPADAVVGTWGEKVLHSFSGKDGANPYAGLVSGPGGLLYGTTVNGGADDAGVVFSLKTGGGTPVVTVLHAFTGESDGANPYAALAVSEGALYGTARNGGGSSFGTLFSVTADGKFAVLHAFAGTKDGANPIAAVVAEGTTIYGAASLGGASNDGTLFRVGLAGATPAFQVLHMFDGAMQSANPLATAILAPSGALLGTTEPEAELERTMGQVMQGGSVYVYCTKDPPACVN